MDSPQSTLRQMRAAAGISQRQLLRRAGTSQPAVARYEGGVSVPSWATLQRLAAACGRRMELRAEIVADPDDVALATEMLALTPLQRLRALPRYANLRPAAP